MSSILDQIDDQPPSGAGASKPRNWSDLQQAVFEACKEPEQNILIQAVAGSGKTTTIIEATNHVEGSSIFLAFNKAIADDIRTRVSMCEVKTFNALGHRLWMENRPGSQLDFKKVSKIVKGIMGETSDEKEHGYTLSRVVGLAKNIGLGIEYPPGTQDFIDLMEAYSTDVPFEKLDSFGTICREAFEQSRLDEKTFDFDDQLWGPIANNWEFPAFSNVFPDECQDLNNIQHEMLQRMVRAGARLVAVGDRHQAIYGFRGASHDSMDALKKLFGMTELPLSISYRCPQEVVREAQQFCPTIQWREGAPLGVVSRADNDPLVFEKHMILCRTNAPLFAGILAHVRARVPCQVMSSFLESFQGFIRGFKATYTSDLRAKLDRWYEREREAARKAGKKGKMYALMDKYETVKLLCQEFTKTEDMLLMVRRLSESRTGPIFATIHKAKGLESDHIWILRPEQLGGFGELTAAQQQQEDNLHYVAITRAADTLTYGAMLR